MRSCRDWYEVDCCAPRLRVLLTNSRHACNQPWLAGPSPTERLPRELLEERILNLLSGQNMCVLATAGADGPLATPVRYYHPGMEVMFSAAPASPKMPNLTADPRISVGLFAPLVGQASSRGAQLFGTARTIQRDDPEADKYWEASAGSPTTSRNPANSTSRRKTL